MCAPAFDFSDYVAARSAFPFRPIAGAAEWPWNGQRVKLEPIDEAEVLVVVDNAIDSLAPPTERTRRKPRRWDEFDLPGLRAEHGLSLLLTIRRNGHESQILYDAGVGHDTALHNLGVLEVRPTQLRALVMSHSHADHHGGLVGFVKSYGRALPLVIHPEAWKERKSVFPDGTEVRMPPPSRGDLQAEGIELVEERGPSLLVDGCVLVTGQVERTSGFEPGLPNQHARANDGWEPDPMVWDDQAVVLNIRDKGLLVLSACSHAGVVNVLRYARKLTGIDKVHGFIGGMHLGGALFERIIPPTLDELTTMGLDVIVPGHCSGWRLQHELSHRLPDVFIPSNVGSTVLFGSQI